MKTKVVNLFKNKHVLLIGDVILDVYVYSNIVNEALYAPIPEVEEIRSTVSFGGNGLVASNILELGGNLTFISVIGNDADAKQYNLLKHPKLKKFFLVDKTRKTTVKRRWYANGRALLQANQVSNHDLSLFLQKKIIQIVEKNIEKVDIVTIMDPQHGMLTKNLITHIIRLCKKHNKPLYVDSQISHRSSNHFLYKGADTMFLNQKEAKAVYPQFNIKKPEQSLLAIKKKLQLNNVVVKIGEHGSLSLFGEKFIKNSPYKVKAIDVCGAGDSFLAAFSLGDRENPKESLNVANIWGALSTTVHGTIPPKKIDLLSLL